MTVVINGRNYEVDGDEMGYEDIVEIAFPGRENTSYLVSYSYRGKNQGGTIPPGGRTELEQGMIFNCLHAGLA
jgi:hypothetical protein